MTLRLVMALSLTAYALDAFAYEVDTHALITNHAFDRSALATTELASRLGIDRFDDDLPLPQQPFRVPSYVPYSGERDAYLDVTQAEWDGTSPLQPSRAIQEYDWQNMYSLSGEDYRLTGRDQRRTKAWLMRGVVREDDLTPFFQGDPPVPDPDPYGDIVRVFRHFYDPIRNDPFTALPCPGGACVRSPDWAFGQADVAGTSPQPPDPARRNHFTWADAREAMYCALTRNAGNPISAAAQNAAERRLCWATTIVSLGHVLHLAQDLAQPQHVRNDAHAPFITTPARRMYEDWTNFRTVVGAEGGAPSTERLAFQGQFGSVATTPIVTGLTYPIPAFPRPVNYFTTRQVETGTDVTSLRSRRGLADFTNRTFFSEGTILSEDYLLPPSDPQSSDFEVQDRLLVSDPAQGQLIERTLLAPVVDPLQGGYVDTVLAPFNGKVPVATLGLWADFDGSNLTGIYRMLPLDNLSVHADVLVPRAIAYSAGLVDHFFRGKLEVTAPLDGLFSVIDHATPHTVSPAGYPIRSDNGNVFGFTKVRLRVRNATAQVNESGTTPPAPIPRDMQSTVTPGGPSVPTMRAVARYHRNPCYQPNLSGERRVDFNGVVTEPAGCAGGTRTPFQEISVSLAVVSAAAQTNGAGQDLVFDFSQQPIPVNATDLVIQVVYHGPLGLETDAIALGGFDIREPSHITLWNNTDYAGCSGSWFYFTGIPPGCILEGSGAQRSIQTTRICIGTQLVFEHLQNPHGDLLVFDYVRLAALLDGATKGTRSRNVVLNISSTEIRDRSITGQVRQSAKEEPTAAAPFNSEPLWIKRGYVGSFRPLPYYQINGADPQPASDAGPLDVGALTQPATVPPAPDPGNILFPDVGVSNMACTIASAQPMFPDEPSSR